MTHDFRLRCRSFMETEGWAILQDMARDKKGRDRQRAIELLAAYAYGKPATTVKIGGDEDNPTPIRYIAVVEVESPKGTPDGIDGGQ